MSRFEVKVESTIFQRSHVWHIESEYSPALYKFCDLLSRMKGKDTVLVTLTDVETKETLKSAVWIGEQKDWFTLFGVNRDPKDGFFSNKPPAIEIPNFEIRVRRNSDGHSQLHCARKTVEHALYSLCWLLSRIDAKAGAYTYSIVDAKTGDLLYEVIWPGEQRDWFDELGAERDESKFYPVQAPKPVDTSQYTFFNSVFRDKDGNYWYNTDYDISIIGHVTKKSEDWKILSRSESEIFLEPRTPQSIEKVRTYDSIKFIPKLSVKFEGIR